MTAETLTLADFLLARIAEDEEWATACEGLHWEWRGNEGDDVVTPDPMLDEYIDGDSVCSLRSVERFPYVSIPGDGPRFLIHAAEETLATAAGHIVRHDPARVLAECEAKRRIVAMHKETSWITSPDHVEVDVCSKCGADDWPLVSYPAAIAKDRNLWGFIPLPTPPSGEIVCETLAVLALPYADHPDYRDEWRP